MPQIVIHNNQLRLYHPGEFYREGLINNMVLLIGNDHFRARTKKLHHKCCAVIFLDTRPEAPNEWYCWEYDLRKNSDIDILLAIDSSSFPPGAGPRPHEIWHSGYYPVGRTNKKYKMLYLNMGHNDIDYDGGTNKELSFQFDNVVQSKLILNGLLWLGRGATLR